NKIMSITSDMFSYDYSKYNVVINTSCEHIVDIDKWLKKVKPNSLVILQSNDNRSVTEHVNCVDSTCDLVSKTSGLLDVIEDYTLLLPDYSRYMIIGKRNDN